jgi:hypothetical protein
VRDDILTVQWGAADLDRLIAAAKRGRPLAALAHVACIPFVTASEVDLVLWIKLGRSISEACDQLNARAAAQGSL